MDRWAPAGSADALCKIISMRFCEPQQGFHHPDQIKEIKKPQTLGKRLFYFFNLVGAARFELTTTCPPGLFAKLDKPLIYCIFSQ
jgi:hypothetical protein